MATQNPIESEGTYPLPEAQVDRFMLKILIGYPEHDEELTIVQRQLVEAPELRQALSLDELKALQQAVFEVYVDPALVSYAVALATATRSRQSMVCRIWRITSRTGRAPAGRSASSSPPGARARPRQGLRARRRSRRARGTRCATGSCSRTRRSPRR
jgi:MoxR-like ATPase